MLVMVEVCQLLLLSPYGMQTCGQISNLKTPVLMPSEMPSSHSLFDPCSSMCKSRCHAPTALSLFLLSAVCAYRRVMRSLGFLSVSLVSSLYCCIESFEGETRSSGFELDHTRCCVSEVVQIILCCPTFVFVLHCASSRLSAASCLLFRAVSFLSLVCRALPLVSLFPRTWGASLLSKPTRLPCPALPSFPPPAPILPHSQNSKSLTGSSSAYKAHDAHSSCTESAPRASAGRPCRSRRTCSERCAPLRRFGSRLLGPWFAGGCRRWTFWRWCWCVRFGCERGGGR